MIAYMGKHGRRIGHPGRLICYDIVGEYKTAQRRHVATGGENASTAASMGGYTL